MEENNSLQREERLDENNVFSDSLEIKKEPEFDDSGIVKFIALIAGAYIFFYIMGLIICK